MTMAEARRVVEGMVTSNGAMVRYADRMGDDFLRAAVKAQKRLLEKMNGFLLDAPNFKSLTMDKRFAWYAANADQVGQMIQESGYGDMVGKYLNEYDELARLTQGVMSAGGFDTAFTTIPKDYIDFIQNRDMAYFAGLNTEATEALNKLLVEQMVMGRSSKEMLAILKGKITGSYDWGTRKGLYEWHAGTYARTAAHRNAQSYMNHNVNQWNAKNPSDQVHDYLYLGPFDAKTRPFCQEVFGQVFNEEEIGELDNDQTGDVMTDRGGWNCRHDWIPVPSELRQINELTDDDRMSLTSEERKARYQEKRANETPAERKARLEKSQERRAKRKARKTNEEPKTTQAQPKISRANETPAQRETRLQKSRERRAKRKAKAEGKKVEMQKGSTEDIQTSGNRGKPPKKTESKWKEAKTPKEAENQLRQALDLDVVNFAGVDDMEIINEICDELVTLTNRYGITKGPLKEVLFTRTLAANEAAALTGTADKLMLSTNYFTTHGNLAAINKHILGLASDGWWAPISVRDVIAHEFGHYLHLSAVKMRAGNDLFVYAIQTKRWFISKGFGISRYGNTNGAEAIAELFVRFNRGEKLTGSLKVLSAGDKLKRGNITMKIFQDQVDEWHQLVGTSSKELSAAEYFHAAVGKDLDRIRKYIFKEF